RLEQRYVESAATQVVDQPRPVAAALGPAGGNGRGDRLLNKLNALEAGAKRGVGGCRRLMQLKQRRNRNHSTLRRGAELISHVLSQRFQHFGRELLRLPEGSARWKLQLMRGAHQAFELAAGVCRICIQETSSTRPDGDVATRIDADHARRQNAAHAVA